MHERSYNNCIKFRDKYLSDKRDILIADVGSYDVNGTYRSIFDRPDLGWHYFGLDITPGPNVNFVVSEHADDWMYCISPSDECVTADVVVSGQCLEHTRKPWKWIRQVNSILKVDGIAWITAPNTWGYHAYPIDCWRIWPDGMLALFDEVGWEPLEAFVDDCDTVGIARRMK